MSYLRFLVLIAGLACISGMAFAQDEDLAESESEPTVRDEQDPSIWRKFVPIPVIITETA